MEHIFHLPGNYSFEKVGHKGTTFQSKFLTDKIEFSIIETEAGHQTKIIQKECIFAYYILEGGGSFEIGGAVENCGAGDLVIVPAGMPFTYLGKLKMLLVCSPWWYPEQEAMVK
jgi:Cupin domain.